MFISYYLAKKRQIITLITFYFIYFTRVSVISIATILLFNINEINMFIVHIIARASNKIVKHYII